MPKLDEYKVPLIVETSSSGKITTSGNPWVFRISPTSEMEAKAFLAKLDSFKPAIKKIDFLSVNNDWGRGSAEEFSKYAEGQGRRSSAPFEYMDPEATDLSAQLAKLKQSGGDTLFLTTGVEQMTLVLKQANELQLPHRIITTGGSFSRSADRSRPGCRKESASYHLCSSRPGSRTRPSTRTSPRSLSTSGPSVSTTFGRPDRRLPRL